MESWISQPSMDLFKNFASCLDVFGKTQNASEMSLPLAISWASIPEPGSFAESRNGLFTTQRLRVGNSKVRGFCQHQFSATQSNTEWFSNRDPCASTALHAGTFA